ncbi:hypothetical protein [Flavobacterium sp. ACAM 123]|uniref:hypothetical protein n=1 Tax=Flavobacterium sp. ACAM 123 TaxID=1189620 RepID=UPI00031A5F59|nr:hypothetical protein [Flavobacterium sp. ACAM 123]
MKAVDNAGLKTVKNIIIESISTSGVYCFGERKKSQSVLNPFSENSSKKERNTHFYLLVLTDQYIIKTVSDICDVIKNRTKGRYTVTMLLHKGKLGNYLTPHQTFFYHEVLTKGYKVYERENMPPNIVFNEVPKRNVDYIRSYWKNRNIIADNFINSQNQIDLLESAVVHEAMIHTAVEQICLGLINVFLGYHPNHFSLAYLFEICEIFTPLVSEIFPQTTGEDKRLFDLLKTNPGSLRWFKLKNSSRIDTELLAKRCKLFHERACELVEVEMERIENLYNKEL